MAFGTMRRFEWILVACTLVAISPFWVVGLRLVYLDSPVVESIFSLGLIVADPLLSIPFFVPVAALLIATEASWLLYGLFSPGTLFDTELRWKKGMPYGRLVPHIIVLGLVVLTYLCRGMLHIQDTLASIGKL
jgi:hypothetical protein